ncbi:MAG: SDR family oxidoreductase [Bradymonadaceae bacterium]|nr:SDR family oxidoreductase [Lujinxingiaceae bacterium]
MAKRFEEKVVWITGGGTGLGLALANEFADQGASVVVSGRRADKLDAVVEALEAKGVRALAVACDVTAEPQIVAAVAAIVAHFGRLDVAVANAGFSVGGSIESLDADAWRRQMETNVVGLAQTARHALPELRKSGGRLVLVGSVLGTLGLANNGPYCASKFAVRGLGQALSLELAGSGVSCTTVQPGFVESEIGRVDNDGVYREEWTDKRPSKLMWPADRAARVVVKAIWSRRREYTFTAHGKLAVFIGNHMPSLVYHVAKAFGPK